MRLHLGNNIAQNDTEHKFYFDEIIQNPTHTFAKAHDKSCFLVAIATTFAHYWGGDSIRATFRIRKLLLTCKHDVSVSLILMGSE